MWMLGVVGSAVFLFACGGGGGGGGGTTTPAAGTVSGTVVKGPVSGATVQAFGMNGGAKGAQLGTGTTDANGSFTIPIGDYTGPVMLQAGGGTYTDEATGNPMTMQAADVMTAAIPAVAAGGATSGIQVTPMTAMAQARAQNMTGGMTAANIATANSAMGAYFSVSDVLHVAPMNPLVAGSGTGATQDQKNYGMAIAAMSQYARTLGMTASSGIVTAMMTDASDGVMNGMMGSTPISMTGMGGMMGGTMQATAGTTGLATAMRDFVGSAMNRSGVALADMQSLVDRLAGSNGQLPGAGGGTTGGTGTMSGTAFMGTMSAGTVTAFAIDGGTLGAQLASAPVDSSGNFSLPLGSFAGPVMLRMTGGAFVDEATGATMTMLSGDELTAGVPSVAAGATTSGVQITPLTSMAQARAQAMSGGMTAANLAAANAAVASFFMVDDLLTTPPMDPAKSGSGTGADQSRRNYGMTIGAMSQYAKTIGMTDSSSLVTVMMSDASDGVMNGMMGSTTISMGGMGGMMGGTMMQPNAGTVGLATAMTTFVGSSSNHSGVTISDMQALIDRLSTSSGTLQ
jgi:hypothetical protein